MLMCPKCGCRIDHLQGFVKMEREKEVILGRDGQLEFNDVGNEILAEEPNTVYGCPECNRVLFRDDELARRFLAGEEVKVVTETQRESR